MGLLLRKNKYKFRIFIICLAIVLSSGYITLIANNTIWQKNIDDIADYTHFSGTSFREIYQRDISLLSEFAQKPNVSDITHNPYENSTPNILSEFASNHNFEYIAVVNTEGNGITNTGQPITITEDDGLKEALWGRAGVTYSKQPTVDLLYLYVPVNSESGISGAVFGAYRLDNIMNVLSGRYAQYSCIINGNGDIILQPDSEGPKDNIYLFFPAGENNIDKIKLLTESIRNQKAGTMEFKNSGKKYLISFLPLNINGWHIATVIPINVAMKEAHYIIFNQLFIGIILLLIFMAFGWNIRRTYKSYVRQIQRLAYSDPLTGGSNYTKFKIDANKILRKSNNGKFAAIYFDIAKFKYINDEFGYEVGDRLLCYIADTLSSLLGNNGIFSRITADKFVVMLSYNKKSQVTDFIVLLISRISAFAELNKRNYKFKVYAGLYCSENAKKPNITTMIDRANIAQKSIKHSSDTQYAFYTKELRESVLHEKEIENVMEKALLDGEFVLHLQPKYEVRSNKIMGAEALVRWQNPQKGIIYPKEFISIFEKNRFITRLDAYVLEKVCEVIKGWMDSGYKIVPISVNVSPIQFYETDFVSKYAEIKEKYGIPDQYIELEFTESIFIENHEILTKVLDELKSHGFVCSLDDFGSGYSSLNLIKDLPVDVLKLDGLFFRKGTNGNREKAVIKSVITMAKELSMKSVAEGVETKEQLKFLNLIGCDMVQGYVYSKPVPIENFQALLWGGELEQTCC